MVVCLWWTLGCERPSGEVTVQCELCVSELSHAAAAGSRPRPGGAGRVRELPLPGERHYHFLFIAPIVVFTLISNQ